MSHPHPIRIANCSGFYGDHLAAPREMLAGPDPVDVLTGDYLAELTMLILGKGLAEYVRSRVVDVPAQLLGQ
jgi:hypothetical protein